MQHLKVSGAVRPLKWSLGVKWLFFQFLTPNLSASLTTPSIYLRFGLPARLLPSGLSKVIFFAW